MYITNTNTSIVINLIAFPICNKKKSHTCEEGTPQNFFLVFIDELEKQIIIKKTVEVGQ